MGELWVFDVVLEDVLHAAAHVVGELEGFVGDEDDELASLEALHGVAESGEVVVGLGVRGCIALEVRGAADGSVDGVGDADFGEAADDAPFVGAEVAGALHDDLAA